MIAIASMLMGEQAVLYKEKINYKLPGGAGYAPHQDAPAYPFIDSHISCMVAIDDATTGNPRRALYPTYNALRKGGLRDQYYAHKLGRFAEPDDRASVRVSLIGDFQGSPVT